MMELLKTGAYLVNGTEIIEDTPEAQARLRAIASGCTFLKKKQRREQLLMVF